jgi:hypothetical protein
MCWQSSVMRNAGSSGLALGVSRLLAILRGLPYTSSATDACGSTLNAVRIPRRTRGILLLVHVAHDGCLQCLVEVFHEPVSCGVAGCHPRELDATHIFAREWKICDSN